MMETELFSISQAARATGLPASVLRFWEEEFRGFLSPCRTAGNQRRYTREDIGVILTIKDLLRNRKVRLEGARDMLERQLRLRTLDTAAQPLFQAIAGKMRRAQPLDEWEMLSLVFNQTIVGVFTPQASRKLGHFHVAQEYRQGPVVLRPLDLGGCASVLFIALGQIGDVVWMKPCIERVRQRWPLARFSILVWDVCRSLYAGHAAIEQEFVLEKMRMADDLLTDRRKPSELFLELERLIERLRAGGFDAAVNLNRILTGGLIASLVNAPRTFGEMITARAEIITVGPLWVALHQAEYKDGVPWRGPHRAEQLLRWVARPAASVPAPVEWGLSFDRAAQLLAEHGYRYDPSRRIIGIQTAARKGSRSWETDKLVELAGLLIQEDGAELILFGADKDREIAERVVASLGNERIMNMTGKTSLAELAGLLKLCEVLVSPNTGPKHLALSVGTPVVEISTGEDSFYSAGPYGPHSVVLRADISCRRCKQHLCGRRLCKERITPQAVLRAVRIQRSLREGALSRPGQEPDAAAVATDLAHPSLEGINVYYSGASSCGIPFTYLPLKEKFSAQRLAKRIYYYALSLVWDRGEGAVKADEEYLRRLTGSIHAHGYNAIRALLEEWIGQLSGVEELAVRNRSLAAQAKQEDVARLLDDRHTAAAAIIAFRWKLNEYRIVNAGSFAGNKNAQVLGAFCSAVAADCSSLCRILRQCCAWCRSEAANKEVRSWERPSQLFPLGAGASA